MSGFKSKLQLLGVAVAIGSTLLGVFGVMGRGVRSVDVLTIFAGGFAAGVTFLSFLRSARPSGDGSPRPPTPKSGA